jgi:hypothetical protein
MVAAFLSVAAVTTAPVTPAHADPAAPEIQTDIVSPAEAELEADCNQVALSRQHDQSSGVYGYHLPYKKYVDCRWVNDGTPVTVYAPAKRVSEIIVNCSTTNDATVYVNIEHFDQFEWSRHLEMDFGLQYVVSAGMGQEKETFLIQTTETSEWHNATISASHAGWLKFSPQVYAQRGHFEGLYNGQWWPGTSLSIYSPPINGANNLPEGTFITEQHPISPFQQARFCHQPQPVYTLDTAVAPASFGCALPAWVGNAATYSAYQPSGFNRPGADLVTQTLPSTLCTGQSVQWFTWRQPDGTFLVQNAASGLCLVPDSSLLLHTVTCDENATAQRFTLPNGTLSSVTVGTGYTGRLSSPSGGLGQLTSPLKLTATTPDEHETIAKVDSPVTPISANAYPYLNVDNAAQMGYDCSRDTYSKFVDVSPKFFGCGAMHAVDNGIAYGPGQIDADNNDQLVNCNTLSATAFLVRSYEVETGVSEGLDLSLGASYEKEVKGFVVDLDFNYTWAWHHSHAQAGSYLEWNDVDIQAGQTGYFESFPAYHENYDVMVAMDQHTVAGGGNELVSTQATAQPVYTPAMLNTSIATTQISTTNLGPKPDSTGLVDGVLAIHTDPTMPAFESHDCNTTPSQPRATVDEQSTSTSTPYCLHNNLAGSTATTVSVYSEPSCPGNDDQYWFVDRGRTADGSPIVQLEDYGGIFQCLAVPGLRPFADGTAVQPRYCQAADSQYWVLRANATKTGFEMYNLAAGPSLCLGRQDRSATVTTLSLASANCGSERFNLTWVQGMAPVANMLPQVGTKMPTATVGSAYSAQVPGSPSAAISSYTLDSKTPLPAGLTMSSTGAITGTPSAQATGTYSFNVQATDVFGTGPWATVQLTLRGPSVQLGLPLDRCLGLDPTAVIATVGAQLQVTTPCPASYWPWIANTPTNTYVSFVNGVGSMCMDSANAVTAPGTPVVQGPCNSSTTQQWTKQTGTATGSVQYKQVASGRCLRVPNLASGTTAVLGDCDGGADLYTTAPAAYTQIALGNGACVAVDQAQLSTNGQPLAVKGSCASPATGASGNLMFVDNSVSPTYAKVQVVGSSKCLDSANAWTNPGTQIVQGTCTSGSTTQEFVLQRGTAAGTIQYKQVATQLCVQLPSTAAGTVAVLGTCDASADLSWRP